jgi:hypothetical protein
MIPVPKNSMHLPVQLHCAKDSPLKRTPFAEFLPVDAFPFEAVPPFDVMRTVVYNGLTRTERIASCPSREAALAAMRLLGVERFEDWTS